MRMQKRENTGDNSDNKKEKEDTALFTNQFKGQCNYCGKVGHKAENCRDNPRKR